MKKDYCIYFGDVKKDMCQRRECRKVGVAWKKGTKFWNKYYLLRTAFTFMFYFYFF